MRVGEGYLSTEGHINPGQRMMICCCVFDNLSSGNSVMQSMSLPSNVHQHRRQWNQQQSTHLQQIIRDLAQADSAAAMPGNVEPAAQHNSTVAHRYV